MYYNHERPAIRGADQFLDFDPCDVDDRNFLEPTPAFTDQERHDLSRLMHAIYCVFRDRGFKGSREEFFASWINAVIPKLDSGARRKDKLTSASSGRRSHNYKARKKRHGDPRFNARDPSSGMSFSDLVRRMNGDSDTADGIRSIVRSERMYALMFPRGVQETRNKFFEVFGKSLDDLCRDYAPDDPQWRQEAEPRPRP